MSRIRLSTRGRGRGHCTGEGWPPQRTHARPARTRGGCKTFLRGQRPRPPRLPRPPLPAPRVGVHAVCSRLQLRRCTFTAFTEVAPGLPPSLPLSLSCTPSSSPSTDHDAYCLTLVVLVVVLGGGGGLAGFLPLHPPSSVLQSSMPGEEKVHTVVGEGGGMHFCCSCCNQTPSPTSFPPFPSLLPRPSSSCECVLCFCTLLSLLLSALCSSCCAISCCAPLQPTPATALCAENPLQNFTLTAFKFVIPS